MNRYIDADKLSETIKEHSYLLSDSINSRNYGMFLDGIMQAIGEAPTADVQEVRHGHWIEDKEAGSLICSECGHFTDEIIGDFILSDEETSDTLSIQKGTVIHMSMNPIYCSRCGAKMDEEEQK